MLIPGPSGSPQVQLAIWFYNRHPRLSVSHQHNALAMSHWGSLNIWNPRIPGEASATFSWNCRTRLAAYLQENGATVSWLHTRSPTRGQAGLPLAKGCSLCPKNPGHPSPSICDLSTLRVLTGNSTGQLVFLTQGSSAAPHKAPNTFTQGHWVNLFNNSDLLCSSFSAWFDSVARASPNLSKRVL